jgi:hypothetical protein
MTKTLAKMSIYFQEHGPNEHRAGRKTTYVVPDVISQGVGKMMRRQQQGEDGGDEKEEEDTSEMISALEPDDLLVDT